VLLESALNWMASAGIIGAVFVFLGRWIAGWWQRRAERRGLLRLLFPTIEKTVNNM